MARGIEIPLVADVGRFISDMDRGADAVGDLADVFDDAGDASERAGDTAGDSMDDAARKIDDAADRVSSSWSDALTELDTRSRAAGDAVGENTRRGFDEASEGAQTFRDEADQTAREAAASFDGSAESIGDAFQEVAANALAGFGPAGAAAGLAIAAGIGVAIAKLTELSEELTEAKEAGAEWAESFNAADAEGQIEALQERFDELTGTVRDAREWWELWQDEAKTGLDQVNDAADKGYVTIRDFMSAFTESDPAERLEQLNALIETQTGHLEKLREERNATWSPERLGILNEEIGIRDGLLDLLEEEADKQRVATELEQEIAEAKEGTVLAIHEKNEAIEEENELLAESAEANRNAAEAELDLADQIAETNETVRDSDKSLNEKRRSLIDLAGEIVDTAEAEAEAQGTTKAYNEVIKENRDAFLNAAEASGISRGEAKKLAREYGLIPKTVETEVTDRNSARETRKEANRQIDQINKTANIDVTASTYQANSAIDSVRVNQESRPMWLTVFANFVSR